MKLGKKSLLSLAAVILLVILLGSIWGFNLFKQNIYNWTDENDNLYITVESKNNIKLPSNLQKQEGIEFYQVTEDITPVIKQEGYKYATYGIKYPSIVKQINLNENDKPKIYLIGETHLGKSQLDVAKKIIQLVKDTEIDAILLEQPDNIQFNFSKYSELKNNPDQAIKSLANAMISQAKQAEKCSQKTNEFLKDKKQIEADYPNLLDYLKNNQKDKFFTTLQTEYNEEQQLEFVSRIQKLNSLAKAMETENNNPQCKEINEKYKNSEYISAADYLYILFKLKDIKIPFYNVESPNLRSQFESNIETNGNLDTEERDIYMSDQVDKLIKQHKFKNMIAVVGAFHLENLERILTEKGFEPVIEYNSLSNKFKPEMAISKNSEIILNTAKKQTNSTVSVEYLTENKSSEVLLNKIKNFVEEEGFDENQTNTILNNFENEFSDRKLKGEEKWEIVLKEDNTNNTITVKKDEFGSFGFEKVDDSQKNKINDRIKLALQQAKSKTIDNEKINFIKRVNNYDENITINEIENKGQGFYVYDYDKAFNKVRVRYYEKYQALMDSYLDKESILYNKTGSENPAVYIKLTNFTSQEVKGFQSTLNIKNKSDNIKIIPDKEFFELISKNELNLNASTIEANNGGFLGKIYKKTGEVIFSIWNEKREVVQNFINQTKINLSEMNDLIFMPSFINKIRMKHDLHNSEELKTKYMNLYIIHLHTLKENEYLCLYTSKKENG